MGGLLGGPCAKPYPPHFLHHLHLVGLTSCGFNLFLALLVLRLVGEMYVPRVDCVGDGEVNVLVVFLVVLRAPFCWDALPLRARHSAKLMLSDVATISLLLLVERRSIVLVSTSSFS